MMRRLPLLIIISSTWFYDLALAFAHGAWGRPGYVLVRQYTHSTVCTYSKKLLLSPPFSSLSLPTYLLSLYEYLVRTL